MLTSIEASTGTSCSKWSKSTSTSWWSENLEARGSSTCSRSVWFSARSCSYSLRKVARAERKAAPARKPSKMHVETLHEVRLISYTVIYIKHLSLPHILYYIYVLVGKRVNSMDIWMYSSGSKIELSETAPKGSDDS